MLDYPLADVIDLLREHLDHNRRTQQPEPRTRGHIPAPAPASSGPRIIYREADDSWF